MDATLRIHVNGEPRAVAVADLAGLMRELGHADTARGLAVAINDEVVPRSGWAARKLEAGDRVEIVGAVQGG